MNMSHIFISYSHDDGDFVNKLANDLLDKNYSVWLDTLNLPGGTTWNDDIMQAIDDCAFYLLVWNANIEGSTYSIKEKDRALAAGKTIIPLVIGGDTNRMWHDVQKFQWIDFRDNYDSAFKKLTDLIPLPIGLKSPPHLEHLMKQGDMTFGSAARLWRSKLTYLMPSGQDTYISLLVERSGQGIQSFLVGPASAKINTPNATQIFMNFTGAVAGDRFTDYLDYAVANSIEVWTILVRGPIRTSKRGDLEYYLPYDQSAWKQALQISWSAVKRVGGPERTPLHLFMNAPVALGAGFCAAEHFRRPISIYQVNLDAKEAKDRYFCAYEL